MNESASGEKSSAVGVIVARFQVPELHEGHRYTIDYVCERHEEVLIILGVSPISTDRNPLSFEMRKGMIESTYPDRKLTIIESKSLPSSYALRSMIVDELITKIFPNHDAIVYGSRDSFIHKYRGIFRKVEVPVVFSGSATLIRKETGVINSADFRAGVIYNAVRRDPLGRASVDVAIVSVEPRHVLLVAKRDEEGKLRFPGVFFNPAVDKSLEDAGSRCVHKEIPTISFSPPQILQSQRIDDWRYKKSRDGIITLFLLANYLGGNERAGRGVDKVTWVPMRDLALMLVPQHQILGEILRNRFE
jgi:bifunctional NMN adenylyltransferase/nudix hydrolase